MNHDPEVKVELFSFFIHADGESKSAQRNRGGEEVGHCGRHVTSAPAVGTNS